MPRKQNGDRANLGEQSDMSSTDVEREDGSMSAGSRSDKSAGSEGIEDPAMEQSSREHMHTSGSAGSGRATSSDMARASKRTRHQRQGHSGSNTDESEPENPRS